MFIYMYLGYYCSMDTATSKYDENLIYIYIYIYIIYLCVHTHA